MAFASGMTKRFEEGVWLVELAPLSDPDLVPRADAFACQQRFGLSGLAWRRFGRDGRLRRGVIIHADFV